jgi:hypothetical protein
MEISNMKHFILIFFALTFMGCAASQVTTSIGVNIGESYQEAAANGTVSAEQSIKAWPYISGLFKGVMASEYELNLPILVTEIIDDLDALAAKETLTDEDKGFVIGSFVRLEYVAVQYSLDRYGVSIFKMVKKTLSPL